VVINGVEFPEGPIAEFCRRHGVRRLSMFGSILREDFSAESDIDMLAEFEPGRTPGMIGFGGMILELQAILGGGRRVDLRTPNDLSPYFRREVVGGSRTLHAA
jgi:predicted nucleotidyltransferase